MSKATYLTTAIPYVNGSPHVGHALDYLLADVYSRFLKNQDINVRLQAGTDEHGNKIFNKAKSLNIPIEKYIDENSTKFQSFINKLGVVPTDFIRTSDPKHCRRCQKIWEMLSPHIYLGSYEGWYCSGCENFIPQKEYNENHGICPDHNAPYERLSEKNYYLRISDFKAQIRAKIESDELLILPDFRKTEILKLLADSPDISISRPKKNLSWGIPVPNDEDQIMYVWIDALSNYLTVLGFPETDISEFWPPAVQFVGKDILRFHAIIWPAILLGLNLPLPKIILSHGHILANGQKMSKTIGNIIDPLDILDKYGLDPFRYFFLRRIDTFTDSDFTWDKFDTAYSNELANDLGNLVQRLAVLCNKNSVSISEQDIALVHRSALSDPEYNSLMSSLKLSHAFDYVWLKIQQLNKDINEKQPWAIAKTDPSAAKEILTSLVSDLLFATTMLSPFLPSTSEKIISIFSAQTIIPPSPLFPKK